MGLKIGQWHDERLILNSRFQLRYSAQSWMRAFAFFCILPLTFSARLPAALAVELRDSDQVTLHPTEPTEITLTGQNLRSESGEIADLWCSSPATIEILDPENKDRNRGPLPPDSDKTDGRTCDDSRLHRRFCLASVTFFSSRLPPAKAFHLKPTLH